MGWSLGWHPESLGGEQTDFQFGGDTRGPAEEHLHQKQLDYLRSGFHSLPHLAHADLGQGLEGICMFTSSLSASYNAEKWWLNFNPGWQTSHQGGSLQQSPWAGPEREGQPAGLWGRAEGLRALLWGQHAGICSQQRPELRTPELGDQVPSLPSGLRGHSPRDCSDIIARVGVE